jgi:hypothetical protein
MTAKPRTAKSFIFGALAVALAGLAMPARSEEKKDGLKKEWIEGIWLAHPFDGPGSEPRMELKKDGKFRMKAQDDSEMEGTWEWKEPDTIVISYPDTGRKVEAKVVRLEENAMVTASVRGRETPYVRLKSWAAKAPDEKERPTGKGGKKPAK